MVTEIVRCVAPSGYGPASSSQRGERFARARELRDNRFIVDFYCSSERIVIELEGGVHDNEAQRGYDQARAGFLEAAGYRVIRMRNRDASREHLEAALREALETNR